MKLTPLVLFLIILTVLVISILFANSFILKEARNEGFITFSSTSSPGSDIYVPQYSAYSNRKLTILFDSLYFDKKNGNLVEIDGVPCAANGTCALDAAGDSIKKILVTKRNSPSESIVYTTQLNSTTQKPIPTDVEAGKTQIMEDNYNHYIYTNAATKYTVLYIAWGKLTFIQIINGKDPTNQDKPTHKNTYAFALDGTVTSAPPPLPNTLPEGSTTVSPKLENLTTDQIRSRPSNRMPSYDNGNTDLYLISQFVYFDSKRGNIVYYNTAPTSPDQAAPPLMIRNRDNRTPSTTDKIVLMSKTVETIDNFQSLVINTGNNEIILVMSFGKNTIVTSLSKTSSGFEVNDCVRFDENGVVVAPPPATPPPPTIASASASTSSAATTESSVCGDDLSCKWYWYFKTLNGVDDVGRFNNDYMLKTEVVPPVCPTCPNCPTYVSGGACTTCGGQGGSGTLCASGYSVVRDSAGNVVKDSSGNTKCSPTATAAPAATATATAPADGTATAAAAPGQNLTVGGVGTYSTTANPDTIGGSLTIASMDTVAGIEGVVQTAGKTITDVAGGAAGLLRDTGSGAVGLLRDTGSGAVGLLKDTGSGIANLGRGAGGSGNASGGAGQNPATAGYYNSYNGQQQGGQPGMGGQLGQSGAHGVQYGASNTDAYSYYGALPSKGGNFMPVTADFSSFRR